MIPEKIKELKLFANKGRMYIVKETHEAKSGHPGGSLSSMDYMTYLYNVEMRIDPKNPKDPDRDRFVLSKGHCAPGLYAVLAMKGFFPEEDLMTIRKIGSYLQGHPNMNTTPGVEFSTGSLGQGYSAACGMANAAKNVLKKDINVYALLGDGEIEEGLVWEASEYAAHYKLDNLCIAVDVNGLQIDRAFASFHAAKGCGKPTVILMKAVKGFGVSYMENVADWHGKGPNDAECAQALEELEAVRKKLEAEGPEVSSRAETVIEAGKEEE